MWNWLKNLFIRQQPPEESAEESAFDERAHELMLLGDKMLWASDIAGARNAYESALRVDAHYGAAWQRRGQVFLQQGEILSATACYVRAIELDPKLATAWCGLGDSIIAYFKVDPDPIFIRDNQVEIISEASHYFDQALKLKSDFPEARIGKELSQDMLRGSAYKLAKPLIFSFHSGGILEKTKREVVSPFLKPGDYRRKTPLPVQDD